MWGLFIVQVIVILLFILLGWAIRKKEGYWLISGFANRPKEEQEQLISNRYPTKVGRFTDCNSYWHDDFAPAYVNFV